MAVFREIGGYPGFAGEGIQPDNPAGRSGLPPPLGPLAASALASISLQAQRRLSSCAESGGGAVRLGVALSAEPMITMSRRWLDELSVLVS